ncbi:unnamed protein product [Phytophthora lilii]|uniref:Unnamed protein product n=1 Tax=Phytophthora lilii TaxID=2077276 RepID=A0A9W6X4Q3_9STRA|nr:unnamed protein product [Phytophthora lilii]
MSTLKNYHDDEALARMIDAAMKTKRTTDTAFRFEKELFRGWLASDKNKPADVFQLLKLDLAGDTLLGDPLWKVWVRYIDEFNKISPTPQYYAKIETLRKSYGDEKLAKLLIAAKEVESTKKTAADLQTLLLNQWILYVDRATLYLRLNVKNEPSGSALKVLYHGYLRKYKEIYIAKP